MRRAHPRSRGENMNKLIGSNSTTGSSPLARGKRVDELKPDAHGRLIPARAGKTTAPHSRQVVVSAHPRSRGENFHDLRHTGLTIGSSPLARGKLVSVLSVYRAGGLIPARAGKTSRTGRRRLPSRAHPRSRGENPIAPTSPSPNGGSSPLARGKLSSAWMRAGDRGLIPARAGKTEDSGTQTSTVTAHPRSRGENLGDHIDLGEVAGSSPLARGKPVCVDVGNLMHRLIPARAGKTGRHRRSICPRWAHPRSRGENERVGLTNGCDDGSSPLARGKRRDPAATHPTGRLIPARAGKTPGAHPLGGEDRAHPRSRGENS